MDELAERLGRVCTFMEEGELEEAAHEAGASDLVVAILTAVRGGQQASPSALERWLDSLDDRMAAAGFGVVTRAAKSYQPLPGTGGGRHVSHRWACPAAHPCERVASPELRPDAPMCAMTGRPFVYGPVRL
ncbi:hypothetical protein ACGF3G_08655 [Streptomyces sp. NPDC048179]|uniref:hypothetical protein n=1 Tax=Streptomyces sp. NPDC048179 TaxID=3365506 RepID=UPI0037112684